MGLFYYFTIFEQQCSTSYSEYAENSKNIGSSQSNNSAFGRVEGVVPSGSNEAYSIYTLLLGGNKKSNIPKGFFHSRFSYPVLTDTLPLQQTELLSPLVVVFEHNVYT